MSRRPASAARAAAALLAVAVLAVVAAGCSSGTTAPQPPTARLEKTSHGVSVVLTPLGAQRIALRTRPASTVSASTVSASTGPASTGQAGQLTVPYDALVYQPSGNPAVYVATGPLTYTRYLVPVTAITGGTVYLKPGALPPGATVVTQGAEELLGVQNGVGEET